MSDQPNDNVYVPMSIGLGTMFINQPVNVSFTIRDYFAAAALQGLLAYDGDCSTAIGLAYHTADAMLDWRKKNP